MTIFRKSKWYGKVRQVSARLQASFVEHFFVLFLDSPMFQHLINNISSRFVL